MNQTLAHDPSKLVRGNVGLTALSFALLGMSFLLRQRGGAGNPLMDSLQFVLVWGYVLLTPILCSLAWLEGRRTSATSVANVLLFVLWILVMLGGAFLHF
jgi:hypothetical protein